MPKTIKRISESKLISDQNRYDEILPSYLSIIKKLEQKYKTNNQPFFASLVNFHSNLDAPKHNWFEYKQGYSEQLVRHILSKNKISKTSYVLDPFTGVGTTNVVAQEMGLKSIGFDINPVASFVSKIKTEYFSPAQQIEIEKFIKGFKPKKISKKVPVSTLLDKSFPKDVFDKLMYVKGYYESISDPLIQSFFKIAYLSIIEDSSLRVKDGNGIKISLNKKNIPDVYTYFVSKSFAMLDDIKKANFTTEANVIHGSLLKDADFKKIKNKKIGIVIFSPPYANCFDYCEVYKLEFWMGDFVSSYDDFKQYREVALRSHVNSKFDHSIKNINKKVEVISSLLSCFNLWNKNIPDMIKGYFDDMTEMLRNLYLVMESGSKCYIVVANSGYKGVLVPTDLLLADIGEKIGFSFEELIFARKIRASSQQNGDLHSEYNNLMRETIIVLKKT